MSLQVIAIDGREVHVKDPVSSSAGVHFWMALKEDGETLATATCILSFELLRVDDEEFNDEPLVEAMARGFAAAYDTDETAR